MPARPLICSFVTAILAAGCGTAAPSVEPAPPKQGTVVAGVDLALLTSTASWVHAREEDEVGRGRLFRPEEGRTFPPARFRMRYSFTPDGMCTWRYLAPNDAHQSRAARCEFGPAPGQVRFLGPDGEVAHEIRIESLSPGELRVAR